MILRGGSFLTKARQRFAVSTQLTPPLMICLCESRSMMALRQGKYSHGSTLDGSSTCVIRNPEFHSDAPTSDAHAYDPSFDRQRNFDGFSFLLILNGRCGTH